MATENTDLSKSKKILLAQPLENSTLKSGRETARRYKSTENLINSRLNDNWQR